jgi:tetratricopeptide (TPR) repeat protein
MNLWKRWFAKSNEEPTAPLSDREYKQLFDQVLQGVAANWDEQRLLKILGDRYGDRQMVVWLRGYGDRLLSEPANPDLAGLLVRLGEIGCGELGVVAQGIGLEMGNRQVETVTVVEPQQVFEKQNDEAEILFYKGVEAYEAARYQESLEYFNHAIAIKSDYYIAWYGKGVSLSRLSRYEEAISAYDRAINIKPDGDMVWFSKGISLYNLGRYGEAISAYDRAIAIKPDGDMVWVNKGISLYNLGRYEEAISAYDRAINIKPDDIDAWFNKGVSLDKLGRYEEVISAYDCAIGIRPDFHEAWNGKGACLCDNLGRYEEAITAFDHAINIKSDYAHAWSNKGIALCQFGRYEEAIAASDRAIDIEPNFYGAWFNKGTSLAKLGRYEEAIAAYDRAISIKPDKHEAWYMRGSSLLDLGRYEEAIAAFDHAINIKSNYAYAWSNKGISLYKLGRDEEAIVAYDRAISITKGNYWQAWVNRGIAASKSDDKGKDAILKLFGQYLPPEMQNPALDRRGYEGQIACCLEGLKYVNQTTEPEGCGRLHQSMGDAHYSHGRRQKDRFSFWRKAIISYETALETLTATPKLETAHLETLQDLIRVLLALDETEKAEGLLRKGTDFLNERLTTKTGGNKERFEKQFRPRFNELTVGLYIQQGKLIEAIEIAEKDKNAFLRDGLLADTTEPSPDYSQMCAFLKQKPNTAIIYWHLSDNALTTFILAPNALSEITLNLLPTPTTENATITQRNQLTDWMTAWQNDYADYGGKKTKSESQETKPQAKGENHPWRVQMEERLANLKNILRITDIETSLADSPHCTQLLLIPLDSLFDSKYTIAYLPSIQVGIKLLNQPKPNYKRLLSIENPDSSITLEDGTTQNLPKLTAAEAESELICRIYGESTRRAKAETTLAEVTAQLTATTPQPHTIFHFTGHGYYDFFSPINSALALSGSDRLTLKAIGNLDLSSYQLACLCACETAIAGNQSITKEYIGIISAFMYSGVANVVSTLWTVESISSALLMIEFHRCYVEEGESADVALASAKHWLRSATNEDLRKWYNQQIDNLPRNHSLILWLRDRHDELSESTDSQPYHHPYHWSAFTITGL